MATDDIWQTPPASPLLAADEVHVWQAALAAPEVETAALRTLLSADELARADRFRLPRLRDKFIVARGTLRTLLSRYLGRPATQFSFVYGPMGKPALADAGGAEPFHFNLSHSGNTALYAFALGREIGVDVECHKPRTNCAGIVQRFFSANEQAMLRSLPDDRQRTVFFQCWTVKEAYLKACGRGLSFPLRQVEVTFAPDGAPILQICGDERDWTCHALTGVPDCAAAVVTTGRDWRLHCWQWA